MTIMRLNNNHPAMEALNKLADKAEELGIEIEFLSGQKTIVRFDGKEYDLQDHEMMTGLEYSPINEFPPTMEFKLTYNKEE